MEVDKSIEATIMDYIRFFPEEKQADYAAMLQRCNFHDATDPCFPIMLFLLFFQESICEKMEQLDFSVQENRDEIRKKQIIAAVGNQQSHKWFKIIMILLTVINLTISGSWIAYNACADRFPKTEQVNEAKEQNQLQEINRYWLEKLESDEHSTTVLYRWHWLYAAGIGLGCSAVFSLIFLALSQGKIKRLNEPSRIAAINFASGRRKKKIFQLFSRITRQIQQKSEENEENEMSKKKRKKHHGQTQQQSAENPKTEIDTAGKSEEKVVVEKKPEPDKQEKIITETEKSAEEKKTAAQTVAAEQKTEPVIESAEKPAAELKPDTENGSLFLEITEAILKIIHRRQQRKKEREAGSRTELKLVQKENDFCVSIGAPHSKR